MFCYFKYKKNPIVFKNILDNFSSLDFRTFMCWSEADDTPTTLFLSHLCYLTKVQFPTTFTCQFESINWLMLMYSFVTIIIIDNGNIAFRSSCIFYSIFACENIFTEIEQISELCVVRHDLRNIRRPYTFFSLHIINIYIFMSVFVCVLFFFHPSPTPAHPSLSHCPAAGVTIVVVFVFWCALWFRWLHKYSLILNSRDIGCVFMASIENMEMHIFFRIYTYSPEHDGALSLSLSLSQMHWEFPFYMQHV